MTTFSDPVCGMQVEPKHALAETKLGDHSYYFCSNECKKKFDQNSQQYVEKLGEAKKAGVSNK